MGSKIAMDTARLQQLIWNEVGSLEVEGSQTDLMRLYATVGSIALACDGAGFSSGESRPPPGAPGDPVVTRWLAIGTAVSDAATGRFGSEEPLPRSAALWEVDAADQPLTLQPDAAWIAQPGVQSFGPYLLKRGDTVRRFRLFVGADRGFGGPVRYLSALTGTGFAAPKAEPRPSRRMAWALGLMGALLFIVAAGNIVWLGRQTALASAWMRSDVPTGGTATQPPPEARLNCLAKLAPAGQPVRPNAAGTVRPELDPACLASWRQATDLAAKTLVAPNILGWLTYPELSYVFGWIDPPGARPAQIAVPIVLMSLGLVGLAAGLGLGFRGTVWGVLLNERNRVSLANTQIMSWTALVLPAIIGFAAFKAGSFLPAFGDQAALLHIFPEMPLEIVAALGITLATPLLSQLVLGRKEEGASGLDVVTGKGHHDGAGDPARQSVLAQRLDPSDASIADLFLGEEAGNNDKVDISRLQMVVISVGLIFVYAQLLLSQASGIDIARAIVNPFDPINGVFASLPAAGATFTALLAVSHGTYLVIKTTDKDKGKQTT